MHMPHDPEGGRNIIEHLGDGLAAADEVGTTADRAGTSRLVNDLLSRQMIRQWLTARPRLLASGRDGTGRDLDLRVRRFDVFQRQLKLLDRAFDLLRRSTEADPPQDGKLGLQLLDQSVTRAQPLALTRQFFGLRGDDRTQALDVVRQLGKALFHGRNL